MPPSIPAFCILVVVDSFDLLSLAAKLSHRDLGELIARSFAAEGPASLALDGAPAAAAAYICAYEPWLNERRLA